MRSLLWPLPCLLLLAPLACSDSSGDTGTTATESGDGDGDTGDGDGDGDTGDGDGDTGDGDGDTGDGDGDTGDGDGDTGDGDGDTGDGDGDGDPVAECESAADCEVVNDCCTCDAVPSGQVPPCDLQECFAATCDAEFGDFGLYVPESACVVGTCVLAPVSCNLNEVLCDVVEPPACQGGKIRSVQDNCYGPCVLPSMCTELPGECDADTCDEGFACMNTQSGAPSRCVPIPTGCNQASCECIQPWLDEVCNGSCSEAGGTLLCEDGG